MPTVDEIEQDALDRKNAVFAAHPSMGNLAVASAMDKADLGNRVGFGSGQYRQPATEDTLRAGRDPAALIDSAILSRRDALNKGIAEGYDPDAPALALSPERRNQMLKESLLIGHEAEQQAQSTALLQARNYQQRKDTETATDVHNFFSGMPEIDKLTPGSPEQRDAFLNHLASHPHAATTSTVRDFAKTYATTHDTAASLLTPPEGFAVDHVVTDTAGKSHAVFKPISDTSTYETKGALLVDNPNARPRQNAKGAWYDSGEKNPDAAKNAMAQELFKAYAITPTQLLNPVAIKAGDKDSSGVFQYKNDGNTFEVNVGGDKGKIKIPKTQYEQFKAGLTGGAAKTGATPAATLAPDDIKAQYKSGKLTKDQATELLKGHGFE